MQTFQCPQCGAAVRVGRLSCPECGSDDTTGWRDSEDIDAESVDLPVDLYGEDRGQEATGRRIGGFPAPVAVVILVLTVLAFAVLALRRG